MQKMKKYKKLPNIENRINGGIQRYWCPELYRNWWKSVLWTQFPHVKNSRFGSVAYKAQGTLPCKPVFIQGQILPMDW